MIKYIYLKTDIKKLSREPIMILLFLVLLVIPIAFRLLLQFLVPFICRFVDFDISLYYTYVLSLALLVNGLLLSIVMAFTMIDDRDNKIVELISVTPLGKTGYILMRLSLVFIFVFIYSLYSYALLGLYIIPVYTLLYLALLLCIYATIQGLLLFSLATDKVNGLTYAKGINIMLLFAFTDLIDLEWLNILSGFFPPYWITRIIAHPDNMFALAMGAVVSLAWLLAVFAKTKL